MVIVITGMHRSGTSFTTNYLSQCGLDIGSNLFPANEGNPLGYYEDQDILDFHRSILREHGLRAFLTSDAQIPQLTDEHRAEAAQMVAAKQKRRQALWGWKEPRTSLFLDFWDAVLNDAGEDVRYLFLFRHPLDVVDSLVRRNTDPDIAESSVVGLKAWCVYNACLLDFYQRNRSRCLIQEIDHVIQNPTALVDQLHRHGADALAPAPLEDVFTKKAFNPSSQKGHWYMRVRYWSTYKRSLQLYETLQHVDDPT